MSTLATGRKRVLLIDTNLLLLLLVGSVDPMQVERFKRTRTYTAEDFDLLAAVVSQFESLVVTPNVLTEVSNLAGTLQEPLRSTVFRAFAVLIAQIDERYTPSKQTSVQQDFIRLGLTDAGIIWSSKDVTVLTDDFPLYLRLSSADVDVLNFNHVRTGAWDL